MRRAVVVVALAALALPASAFAHASLQEESPSFAQEVQVSPRQIVLQFDEAVDALPGSIEVLNPAGRNVARDPHAVPARRALVASVPRLPKGPYTVRWQALSDDGHIVSGVYTFGVRVPAPAVTDAVGAEGPTRTEDIVRWLYFLGLALVVGGVGFRLLVVRGPLPPRAQRRFFWVAGIGVVVVLESGIAAFILRGQDFLHLPFSRLLYGDLSPLANGTRYGEAFVGMELGFALVCAVVYLAWLTERTWLLWCAFALGLVFVSGLSLSGHSAADPRDSWLSELADWVHLSAALIWVGGLVQLAAVVWPGAPELRAVAFRRFSRVATVCVGLLVAAGVYLAILRLQHLHDLWRTGYGHVLLVKSALVLLAFAWGGCHRFLAVPRIDRPGVMGTVARTVVGESMVAVSVLLLAAVLTDSKPPAPAPVQTPPPVAAVSARR